MIDGDDALHFSCSNMASAFASDDLVLLFFHLLRTTAECLAHLSQGLGVCLSVRPSVCHTAVLYQNGARQNH